MKKILNSLIVIGISILVMIAQPMMSVNAANINLIKNGSFETGSGDISGGCAAGGQIYDWIQRENDSRQIKRYSSSSSGGSFQGGIHVSFNSCGTATGASLSQSFETVPSTTYTLTLYAREHGDAGAGSAQGIIKVTGNGILVNSTLAPAGTNWRTYQYFFTADGTQATVEIIDTSSGSLTNLDLALDNVSVVLKQPIKDTSLTKAFDPSTIDEGGTSTLTFTITENTTNDGGGNKVSFTDTLRSGLVIADPANVQNTCSGGKVTAGSGGTTISVAGAVLLNGTPNCSISVDVTAATARSYINGAADISDLDGIETSAITDQTLTVNSPCYLEETNLVENGSFEEPPYVILGYPKTIPGWQLSKGLNFEIQSGAVGKAYDGKQNLELDTFSSLTEFYQDIPTEEGQNYELSFAFSPRPDNSDNKLNVRWGDTLIAELDQSGEGLSNLDWVVYTYKVQAIGPITRLSFDNLNETQDGLGSLLDAVSVKPFVCP